MVKPQTWEENKSYVEYKLPYKENLLTILKYLFTYKQQLCEITDLNISLLNVE